MATMKWLAQSGHTGLGLAVVELGSRFMRTDAPSLSARRYRYRLGGAVLWKEFKPLGTGETGQGQSVEKAYLQRGIH